MIIGAVLGYNIPLAPYISYHEELKHRYNNFFVSGVLSLIISSVILTVAGYPL
jgi:hypothetical protein